MTELFWSRASIVSVPSGLLIRCSPRSLPGESPLPSKAVAPRRSVPSAIPIRNLLPSRPRVRARNRKDILPERRRGGTIADRPREPYDEDRLGRYRVADAWAHRAGSVRSSPQSERTSRLDPCLLVQGPRPGWMMARTIPIASPQYAGSPANSAPLEGPPRWAALRRVSTHGDPHWRAPWRR